MTLFKPVKTDSRNCFGISWFATEKDAAAYAAYIESKSRTYIGGWMHGRACGREPERDYVDPELGQLYAVTD